MPSKICSWWHFKISIFFFFIFQRKQVLMFHVNHLLGRWFTWNVKTCFLWKIIIIKKKNRNFRLLQFWLVTYSDKLTCLKIVDPGQTASKGSFATVWPVFATQLAVFSNTTMMLLVYPLNMVSTENNNNSSSVITDNDQKYRKYYQQQSEN